MYQNNGYYAIKQDTSGYYVTSTGGAAKLGAKSGSFTNNQLWKLINQSDGTYMIQSKADPAYYITEESANHSMKSFGFITNRSIHIQNHLSGREELLPCRIR